MITAAFVLSILDDLRSVAVDLGTEPDGTVWLRAASALAYLAVGVTLAWLPAWTPLAFLAMLVVAVSLHASTTLVLFVCLILAFAAYAVPVPGLLTMLSSAVAWLLVAAFAVGGHDLRLLWWLPVMLVAVVPGWAVRVLSHRNEQQRRLAEEQERAAREREEEILEAGRRSREHLSRELHDVVAHELTRIAMRSSVSQLTDDPAEHRAALHEVAASARNAMGEMRRLVRILHEDSDADDPGAPGSGVGAMRLSEELERAAAYLSGVGFSAEVGVTGDESRVPVGLCSTGVAVIREASTNIVKHGHPDLSCRLSVTVREHDVVVEARNEQGEALLDVPDSGLGIAGLASRVAEVDGVLDHGPDGAWWVLRATMPLGEVA